MLNSHVKAARAEYLTAGAGCFFVGYFLLSLTWFSLRSVYGSGHLRCRGW